MQKLVSISRKKFPASSSISMVFPRKNSHTEVVIHDMGPIGKTTHGMVHVQGNQYSLI